MTPEAPQEPAVYGVPKWLANQGIKTAEWQYAVKTQFRSLMRPCFPLKVRVWAHGILQSTGYKQELAVRQYKDSEGNARRRPLRPKDTQEELHRETVKYFRPHTADNLDKLKESRQNIRRAYEDLENDGVMERRRASDQKPIRELSESEARKLTGGDKIHYYFFLEPRPASKESVLQEYEERLASIAIQKATRSSHPLTTCSAEQLRSIRHIAKAFGLQDSPFFRLDENTPAEHVAAIMQAIERAKDSFIAACKEAEPEAKFEPEAPAESEAMPTEPERAANPTRVSVTVSESLERSAQGKAQRNTERPTEQPAAEHSQNSDPFRELRAGLVARGIDTLDDGALSQIAGRLDRTPLDRYWLQLGERMKRGRPPFKALLEHATAATKNYQASQQILQEQEQYVRGNTSRRREEEIREAREILKKPPDAVPALERQWAEMVLREAS